MIFCIDSVMTFGDPNKTNAADPKFPRLTGSPLRPRRLFRLATPYARQLKDELQAKLDLPRRRRRVRKLAEGRQQIPAPIEYPPEVDIRCFKVRMVQNVEDFRPKLQFALFGDPKMLVNQKIDRRTSRTDQSIPPQIAEGSQRLRYKGARIEPVARRSYRRSRRNNGRRWLTTGVNKIKRATRGNPMRRVV